MNPIFLGVILFFIFGGVGVKTVIDNSIIPTTYDGLFKKYGSLYNVNWLWLKRICMIESTMGKNPRVKIGLENPSNITGSVSTDGKSWGLMQVTIPTARDFDPTATEAKLNNPDYAVKIAAMYLNWVKGRFPTTDSRYEEWVIKSYNQGVGNTAKERAGTFSGAAGEYWAKYKKFSAEIK